MTAFAVKKKYIQKINWQKVQALGGGEILSSKLSVR